MDGPHSPADELPALYRAVLDRVSDLEGIGQRRAALIVRAEATRAYSRAWDENARRRLAALCRRADRVIAGPDRPRSPQSRGGRAVGAARGSPVTR